MSDLDLRSAEQVGTTATGVDSSRFNDYIIASNETGGGTYRPMPQAKFDTSKPVGGKADVPKMDTSIYPEASKKPTLLKGYADKADPDAGNEEVLIGWNKWAQDVQLNSKKNLNKLINHPSELTINDEPVTSSDILDGIEQQNRFSVRFNRDGHVASVKQLQSSGNKIFDKISETAITDLDGTASLRFPAGSQRRVSAELQFGFRPGAGRDDLRQLGAERVTRARQYYESEN